MSRSEFASRLIFVSVACVWAYVLFHGIHSGAYTPSQDIVDLFSVSLQWLAASMALVLGVTGHSPAAPH